MTDRMSGPDAATGQMAEELVASSFVVQLYWPSHDLWQDILFFDSPERALRIRDERRRWFPEDQYRAIVRRTTEEVIERALAGSGAAGAEEER